MPISNKRRANNALLARLLSEKNLNLDLDILEEPAEVNTAETKRWRLNLFGKRKATDPRLMQAQVDAENAIEIAQRVKDLLNENGSYKRQAEQISGLISDCSHRFAEIQQDIKQTRLNELIEYYKDIERVIDARLNQEINALIAQRVENRQPAPPVQNKQPRFNPMVAAMQSNPLFARRNNTGQNEEIYESDQEFTQRDDLEEKSEDPPRPVTATTSSDTEMAPIKMPANVMGELKNRLKTNKRVTFNKEPAERFVYNPDHDENSPEPIIRPVTNTPPERATFAGPAAARGSTKEYVQKVCQRTDLANSYRAEPKKEVLNVYKKAENGRDQLVCTVRDAAATKTESNGSVSFGSIEFKKSKQNPMPYYDSMKLYFEALKDQCATENLSINACVVNLETISRVDQLAQVFLAFNEVFNADYNPNAAYQTQNESFDAAVAFKQTAKLQKLLTQFSDDKYTPTFDKWLQSNKFANTQIQSLKLARSRFNQYVQNNLVPDEPKAKNKRRFGM